MIGQALGQIAQFARGPPESCFRIPQVQRQVDRASQIMDQELNQWRGLSRLCGGSSYSFYGIVNIGSARAAQGGVADMYERDLPLLRKKFPQLQYSPINNETMAGLPWRWEYKNLDGVVLAVDWQSECAPTQNRITESSIVHEN